MQGSSRRQAAARRPAKRGQHPANLLEVDAMTQPGNQRWRELALCAQTDPEAFFPQKGHPSHAARRICAACPVRAACLSDALDRHDTAYGVLGGTTPAERRALLRQQAALKRCDRRWAA